MRGSAIILRVFVLVACVLLSAMAADSSSSSSSTKKPAAETAPTAACGTHHLGAHFTDFRIPEHEPVHTAGTIVFIVGLVAVLGVSGLNTYIKVRSGEQIPGWTNAAYIKDFY